MKIKLISDGTCLNTFNAVDGDDFVNQIFEEDIKNDDFIITKEIREQYNQIFEELKTNDVVEDSDNNIWYFVNCDL